MKLLAAGIALFLLSSAGAEAGLFSSKSKLPKPIDSPIVRPKVRDDHKAGKRAGKHPAAIRPARLGRELGTDAQPQASSRDPRVPEAAH